MKRNEDDINMLCSNKSAKPQHTQNTKTSNKHSAQEECVNGTKMPS